jgi:hypothetical protein
MLVGFGRDFRRLKLNKVLVGEGRGGDWIGVRYSVAFKNFLYKIFLGKGYSPLLIVAVYTDA